MLQHIKSTSIVRFVPKSLPCPDLDKIESGKKELYDFQVDCVNQVYGLINQNIQRILLIAACATGKTTMASQIIKDAVMVATTPTRCMFLVSLNCLIDQARETLEEFGVESSVLQGTRKFDETASVVVASIQTIRSRLKKQELGELLGSFGVIFADEAHVLCYDKIYELIQKHYLKTGTCFIGLTATPWRNSPSQYLGQWFDAKVVAPQPPELVKQGKLVPVRIFGFGQTFDYSEIDIGWDGDYVAGQVEAQAIAKDNLAIVVKEYERLASDRLAAAFCVSVHHAQKLCEAFNEAGVSSEYIDGSTHRDVRKEMFKRLDAGITRVLCSVGTLTAGWNSKKVSCIICVRPTMSKALFFQMSGRGGRLSPGKKDYLLLDFGNNVQHQSGRLHHGNPMGWQDYDISGDRARKVKEIKVTTKECFNCGAVIQIWTRVCPECGHEFGKHKETEEEKALNQEAIADIELAEIFTSLDREKLKFFRTAKKRCFQELVHPKVAEQEFLAEFGHLPPREWHLEACLGSRYSVKSKQRLEAWLKAYAPHDYWYQGQMKLEFPSPDQAKERAKKALENRNWWRVLGVTKNATKSEVKEAYKALAMIYHPDVNPDPDATKYMALINDACDRAMLLFNQASWE